MKDNIDKYIIIFIFIASYIMPLLIMNWGNMNHLVFFILHSNMRISNISIPDQSLPILLL